MKRVLLITAVLALLAGAGGAVWLKTRADAQNAVTAAQEQPEQQLVLLNKYEIGPPDPQEILELVNAERERIGVAPLVMDENVRMSAQLKADDMLNRGYKQHNIPGTDSMLSPEMAELMYGKANCSISTENLYWAGFAATSRNAFAWWMNSEPHRKAIQNPEHTRTGFGVGRNHDDSEVYVVQHFCIP